MRVKLLSYTKDPEVLVATAANLCYSSKTIAEILIGKSDTEKAEPFIKKLLASGHLSPFEHVSFTFSIEEISRACLAQLTRHRIASFSVQSQRYVSMDNFEALKPKAIEESLVMKNVFDKAINEIKNSYEALQEILYDLALEEGMSKHMSKSFANENARALLPNAAPTNLIMTMNARQLLHFLNLRMCNRAQDEIRELAYRIHKIVYDIAPSIFESAGPSCIRGKCEEGEMTCGKSIEVKRLVNKNKIRQLYD